ncbi:hypothetical protein TEPIDINF_002958 [Tepidibacillus infernus]|uniref:hypothetical protein n=1 Tax=Tepidibacillus infernus TaxID=1806172 RepID=UPI003B6A71E1
MFILKDLNNHLVKKVAPMIMPALNPFIEFFQDIDQFQKRRYTTSYPQVPIALMLQWFEALIVLTDFRIRA